MNRSLLLGVFVKLVLRLVDLDLPVNKEEVLVDLLQYTMVKY